jgi:hypothetical protein
VERQSLVEASIEVTIPEGVDIVLVLESPDMPFLRTVMSSEQIETTVSSPTRTLDPGEFNAVTTYLAGLL